MFGRKWQPTPVFLPGESHGQRSVAGHGPWGCRESDMTEATKYTCMRCSEGRKSKTQQPVGCREGWRRMKCDWGGYLGDINQERENNSCKQVSAWEEARVHTWGSKKLKILACVHAECGGLQESKRTCGSGTPHHSQGYCHTDFKASLGRK